MAIQMMQNISWTRRARAWCCLRIRNRPRAESIVDLETIFEFDESWYLETYEDVAWAVGRGDWPSGYMHYCTVGRSRGRIGAPRIDEEWYRAAYPLAAVEGAARQPRGGWGRASL